jgi:hypothetical protein
VREALAPAPVRWIGVREDHTGDGEPVNGIVAIDLDQAGASPGYLLVAGNDFFCSARLSPDGNRMVWLAWDHPNMPWNGTTLHLADIGADGMPTATRAIAGGVTHQINFTPARGDDLVVGTVLDRGHQNKRTRRAGGRHFRVGS